MWKGRFSQDTDEAVQKFTQSLDMDWRMALADIRGSIAHVRMLGHTGLLSEEEATVIEKIFAWSLMRSETGPWSRRSLSKMST